MKGNPPTGQSEHRPVFFAVSPLKLFVMGTATLGLYQLYWFKENWKMLNEAADRQVSPFWRTFFAPFFCFSLFSQIKETTVSKGGSANFPAGLLAFLWIAFTVATLFTSQFLIMIALSSLVILPVQMAANKLNDELAPDHDRNAKFSLANLLGIACGVAVAVLMILLSALVDGVLKSIQGQ